MSLATEIATRLGRGTLDPMLIPKAYPGRTIHIVPAWWIRIGDTGPFVVAKKPSQVGAWEVCDELPRRFPTHVHKAAEVHFAKYSRKGS